MTKQTEALKLALEGAANYIDALGGDSRKYRQALAEQPAQQEPVAWATQLGEYAHIQWGAKRPEYPMVYEFPLYTRPQAREPLTDDEIESINVRLAGKRDLARLFARDIEAAHGITGETQ